MAEWVSESKSIKAADMRIRGKTIPGPIINILHNRGYDSPDKVEKYFAPSLSDLYDPFLMNDMGKAVERLAKAVHNKEKILVHGDYDTDGITGCALLVNNLRKLGIDVEYYIPHRLEEGYGLSLAGIDHAVKNGCSLIVTIDCGISAIDEVLNACKQNIDVIITDHHKPRDELPQAYALLNPKIDRGGYPFKELAGVGVAFKMLQALSKRLRLSEDNIYDDLDLVALGTVVDVVPLVDENRILVKYGMKKILKSKKTGFKALLEETGLKGGLTSYHLGYVIGPRINACGRMRDAKEALELFLTSDSAHAIQLVRNLSRDNKRRQDIESAIYDEARSMIEKQKKDVGRIIVLAKDGWHEGIVGIVASRISEDYHRPTILLVLKDDCAKGSARSIPGFDITEALGCCVNILTRYGGHSQAAGLEIKKESLDQLDKSLNEYAEKCDDTVYVRKNTYDMELGLDKITDEVVYFLKFFEPTGLGNAQPLFLSANLDVVGVPRVVGSNHLKFALRFNKKVFEAIAYGKADKILDIEVGKTRIDCLYSVSEDSFLGKKKIILKIREMRKTDAVEAD